MLSKDFKIDLKAERVAIYDKRFYKIEGNEYPSVTTILEAAPKHYALLEWLKRVGADSSAISKDAMEDGSDVHHLCERYLRGEQVSYHDFDLLDEDRKFYSIWKPFQHFVNACEEFEIIPLLIEQELYSEKDGFAGTLDLLALIKVKTKWELCIIDLKRSKNAGLNYNLQLAAYTRAIGEMKLVERIQNIPYVSDLLKEKQPKKEIMAYILLLNVDTRKGYRLVKVDDIDHKYDVFLAVKQIWEEINPNARMIEKTYPLTVEKQEYATNYTNLIGDENNG